VELLAVAAATLGTIGLLERLVHRRRLAAIPTRVHVSGTRGKSSVTRLIAAGLRESGVRTVAKTTGTLPRMILPDAREVPVFRPSGANIIEQTRIVAAARSLAAEALVMECMALQPELHWISENKLVRATHGVITNARADHLDVMGPTEADVAMALAGMIPVRGTLFTAERRHLEVLRRAAEDRGTRLVAVGEQEIESVTDAELAPFSYVEHRENVALALRVLAELGVEREKGLQGMHRGSPDPGALFEYEVDFFGRRIVFVNGFAANDPQSTDTVWRMATARHLDIRRAIAVFNLRADRPIRTVQLARDCAFWHDADKVVLMGSGAYHFARAASRTGVPSGRFVYAENLPLDEVFETIVGLCGRQTLVIGLANIGGPGLKLVRYFRHRRALGPGEED
jgi:poly-gamma-glutamate synthase PgsB/CapB